MYLLPRPEMASRLDKAWAFLMGETCEFKESVPESPKRGEAQFKFVMPVISPKDTVDEVMAIGLLMDETIASKMAGFMFGSPEAELSSLDLKDVCREACNVLGSCLVKYDDGQSGGVELGLPQEVSSEDFLELQANATVSVTFGTQVQGRRVVITVFDAVSSRVMEFLS